MINYNNRIIIGTAQFSNNYGLSKIKNNIPTKHKLLDKALEYKYHGIDTALEYGNAQKIIGSWVIKNKNIPKIYTKISGLGNINELNKMFSKCLEDLKVNKVEALLIHNQSNWRNKSTKLFAEKLINTNQINHIGVSVYDEEAIPDDSLVSILQIPINIFNHNILYSKKIERFINKGGEVHVRSIFLQGLLLMNIDNIPNFLISLKEPLSNFQNLCKNNNIDPLSLCTNFILKRLPNCKLVLGSDSLSQLDGIINKINIEIDDNIIKDALKLGNNYPNKLWDPRSWNN